MEPYFFRPNVYEKLYNCSQHTMEEWKSFGRANKGIGVVYFLIGVMYEVCTMLPKEFKQLSFQVLYFPCLYVMRSPKFLRFSCYKIMYYLGLVDVGCIIINSCVSGFLSYHGAVFCEYPRLIYLTGCISLGLWCSACMVGILFLLLTPPLYAIRTVSFPQNIYATSFKACMLLALNRLFDLLRPKWMEILFGDNKTYIWLLGPIVYGG